MPLTRVSQLESGRDANLIVRLEALTGLATVRAYRDQPRFITSAQDGVDGKSDR